MDNRIAQPRILKKTKRWLTGCLLFLVLGCNQDENTSTSSQTVQQQKEEAAAKEKRALPLILAAKKNIQTGDMITRTGNDFTSFCFRQFCQADKTYSHCGIAVVEGDTVFVYHALGGEFNPDQKILKEPFEVFVASFANNGFGVFRFNLPPHQFRDLIKNAEESFRNGISFDMKFDLATDDKMYCSEYTAKMYRRACQNDTLFTPSRIATFEFLSPDNLFTHPLCRPVYKTVY
jgi:hypothetical protein